MHGHQPVYAAVSALPAGSANPGPQLLGADAKILVEAGARIIPIGTDKRPLFRWGKYRTQEPTADEIRDWCIDTRTAGWAVLTGPVSDGWMGIDIEAPGMDFPQIVDPLKDKDKVPRTAVRRSQHGGVHVHVKVHSAPADYDWSGQVIARVKSKTSGLPVLLAEVRGDGQYIVVTGPGRPPLPENFSPHPMAPEYFDALIAPGRTLHDASLSTSVTRSLSQASAASGVAHAAKQVKGDTGDVLRQAVLAEPDIWPLLLDPGWTIISVQPKAAQNQDGEWETRVTMTRPDYGTPAVSESGNGQGPVLVNFSTSVSWWPSGKIGEGLSAMHAVAYAWFGGDYREATRAAEVAAENLVVNGVAPAAGGAFAAWPEWLLEDVHTARVKQQADWRTAQATGGMAEAGLTAAAGPAPEAAESSASGSGGATVTQIEAVAARNAATAAATAAAEAEKDYQQELRRERARRRVKRTLADEDAATQRALRVRRTAAEFAAQPPIEAVMDKILAVEANLLGGPSEAGKSLLARDWCLSVAAGVPWRGYGVARAQDVLWVASEGLHDFGFRWSGQPLWTQARDRVHVYDVPVSLLSDADIDAFIASNADLDVGLVVFDIIYGMGMADDTGSKDAFPVMAAMKRISLAMHAATLALGHPGHNGERRFRGASSWRQQTTTEYHLAGGSFTCEKSKLTEKTSLTASYLVDYPDLQWLTSGQVIAGKAAQQQTILDDIARHPADSDRVRADRLAGVFGRKAETVREWIKDMRKAGSIT